MTRTDLMEQVRELRDDAERGSCAAEDLARDLQNLRDDAERLLDAIEEDEADAADLVRNNVPTEDR